MKTSRLFVFTAFMNIVLIGSLFIALHNKTDSTSTSTAKGTKRPRRIPNPFELEGWEMNSTRDPRHFLDIPSIIIPNRFCSETSFLLVIVFSKPSSRYYRRQIRISWARFSMISRYNVSVYFLLAATDWPNRQERILMENSTFGDIIQEGFVDSYYNLTLKSLMMLKLVHNHCRNAAQYLFKVDEDSLINLGDVTQMLVQEGHPDLLIGELHEFTFPSRDPFDKWFAPIYLYPDPLYPDYLDGSGYLMSMSVAEKLYKATLKTELFHVEDVYVTGICAKKAGVVPLHSKFFFHVKKGASDYRCFKKYYLYNSINARDLVKTEKYLRTCHEMI